MKKKQESRKPTRGGRKTNKVSAVNHKNASQVSPFDMKLSKSIIDHSPMNITILASDGSVSYTSPSIRQVHGTSKKSIEHKSMITLIHPEDVPKVRELFRIALKKRGLNDFGILRMHLKDGTYHSFKCSSDIMEDSSGKKHIVVYSSDITDQISFEKALEESEKRFHSLADSAEDMIFIVNRDMIVEYVNKNSASQFKTKPNKMAGKPLSDFFPSFTYKRQSISLGKVFKSGKSFYVANDTPFPGGQKLLDTWLVPIKDESGKVKSVFGISRDVTKYKQMAEDLRLKTAESEEAKARAQTYVDFLAHDVANLISPVLTYSDELAKKEFSDPDVATHLDKIYTQTQRTARLIMDIRMLVEAEKCPQNTNERFNLGDYFSGLQQMIAKQFPDRCHMILDFPKNRPAEVVGGNHIKNAFMQGFSNSMDMHANTCIDVNVKIIPIKKGKRQFWQVRMEMPNRPMSTDWKDLIVTPFDPSRRTKGKSIDSIAFASAIIQHFGGELRVEHLDIEDPTKGHTVVIELPRAGTWHNSRNT